MVASRPGPADLLEDLRSGGRVEFEAAQEPPGRLSRNSPPACARPTRSAGMVRSRSASSARAWKSGSSAVSAFRTSLVIASG